MAATDDLVLEILDYTWRRLAVSPNVLNASVTEELGTVGEADVTIPADDPAIFYIPDPNSAQSNEGRWRLYEGNDLIFAGVIDQTTRSISEKNTYTFGGAQRGVLLGTSNMGRRDFVAWRLSEIYKEFLRDNIGKAPITTVVSYSSFHSMHPPINAIIGDVAEFNYWASATSGTNHFMTLDVGHQESMVGVRVIPPWWDQRWYKFKVETSTDNAAWTLRGTYNAAIPLSSAGKLYEFNTDAQYVKVTVTSSSDQIGRLASVLVYRKLADVGPDTDYLVPWIENDDSGNVTATPGKFFYRRVTNGAFPSPADANGGEGATTFLDGVGIFLGGNAADTIHHRFRGTAESVYFTQGTDGGSASADIYLDNNLVESVDLEPDTYQTLGYEVANLTNGEHHLKVIATSGTPKVDYFSGLYETSYRKIRDDDSAIAYYGAWENRPGENFTNYGAMTSNEHGAQFFYEFKGDSLQIKGTKASMFGHLNIYIDGGAPTQVDCYNATPAFQQTLFQWSGSYGVHDIRGYLPGTKNASSQGYWIQLDELAGNFEHTIYMRSFYENNNRILLRLSEITNSFLRYNHDGSIDLLGQVGDWAGTVIREGENEGGTMISANAENDYSETASAVLALVTGSDDVPIKAFVVDRNAVKRMGLKIRKAEEADANDAYLLTRQAWQELQDHVNPEKRYTVVYDPEEVGDIEVGQTTVLYSQKLALSGSDQFRVGRLVTEYSA